MESTGTGAADFISMTEPSKLVEKAIGIGQMLRTWNSVKKELLLSLCLASSSSILHNY